MPTCQLTTTSTCIISIIRLQSLYVVSTTDDISWDNPMAAILSSTEVNVGILCSCIPTLKGLVSRFFPTLFSQVGTSLHNSRSRNMYASGPKTPQSPHFDLELNGHEKGLSRSQIYAEHDPRIAQGRQYDQSYYPPGREIRVHKSLDQDMEPMDDETTDSRESIRHLAPQQTSYYIP